MAEDYNIAFWNLENLFAPEGFADREPWLAKRMKNDLKGWTKPRFEKKISQLALGIEHINNGAGPDLLGVCEVENKFVLDTLIAELAKRLPGRAYKAVHVDNTRDHRGIDTAFLFDANRLKVNKKEVFSHFVMRRTGTRDITQATFITKRTGSELIALANHWPSRSGGAERSAGFRMTAGESLGYWHERIREVKGPDAAIIALGDFNDDPHDPSLTIHANSTRERTDVTRARSAKFYNLSWRFLSQRIISKSGRNRMTYGTLYYKGNANVFDQILVSKGLFGGDAALSCDEDTAKIDALPAMVSTKESEGSVRFGLPKGKPEKNLNLDGFSDHFPISVVIREA